MADEEDDYLSDKFLFANEGASGSGFKTYSDKRKEAQRHAESKSVQNRKKSRRQLEEEALKEGLTTSLFERAKVEEQELGTQNKAMSLMMKMGFKPGGSLGKGDDRLADKSPDIATSSKNVSPPAPQLTSTKVNVITSVEDSSASSSSTHRKVPLAIDIWAGKQGVGLGKRAPSPGALERLAKAAKLAEETDHATFRSRARQEYEERRAEGRLHSALRTLATLDEQAGIDFNVLSLDPRNRETFPAELLDALDNTVWENDGLDNENEKLKRQMQADALQPLTSLISEDSLLLEEQRPLDKLKKTSCSDEVLEQAKEFLKLPALERLDRTLSYLRETYHYCFWCGTQYNDAEDLAENCPGKDEDAHD